MLKKLRILLLALLTALCCTVTAWADYDYIDRYDVTAAPNVDDGSLTITVDLTWTALEELPYGQELKIGVPNGSVRDEEALTDNIERLSFDNSYMYVYLDRAYRQGETFTFSYRWVQEYMYTLSGNTVTFDYTPGWFDEARVGEMTLKWIDPAGLIGDLTAAADAGGTAAPQTGMMTITASDLGYGETMGVHAVYTDWPTVLSSDNSAVNAPNDGWYDGDEDEDTSMAGMFLTLIITIFIVWVVVRILRELCRRRTCRLLCQEPVRRGKAGRDPFGETGCLSRRDGACRLSLFFTKKEPPCKQSGPSGWDIGKLPLL